MTQIQAVPRSLRQVCLCELARIYGATGAQRDVPGSEALILLGVPAGSSTANTPVTAERDLLCPADDGVRKAVCVTRQHRRSAHVGRSVDLQLPDTDARKDWNTER